MRRCGRRLRTVHNEEATMRLSWRDAVETVLAAVVVVAVGGVLQGQDWPLLGTDRSAALAMFAVGFAMCQLGRGDIKSAADLVRGPFMTTATILGAARSSWLSSASSPTRRRSCWRSARFW
jgi:hypothetical protein